MNSSGHHSFGMNFAQPNANTPNNKSSKTGRLFKLNHAAAQQSLSNQLAGNAGMTNPKFKLSQKYSKAQQQTLNEQQNLQ